jgi:hypothetical protein
VLDAQPLDLEVLVAQGAQRVGSRQHAVRYSLELGWVRPAPTV